MSLIQDLFRTHGPQYLEHFGHDMPAAHHKVIEALAACRTAANGAIVYHCEDCDEPQLMPRCCGNRHCPGCQQHKGYAWLERQLQRQLPVHYFMLTFTVPEQLRGFLRAHQCTGYSALFEASAGAIKKLVPDPHYLGADTPGFFGVLHTWGRALQYHPHIHYVVPGGAFDSRTHRWQGSSPGFYLPVQALSIIFRAKSRDAMHQAGLLQDIPAAVWNTDLNGARFSAGSSTLRAVALEPPDLSIGRCGCVLPHCRRAMHFRVQSPLEPSLDHANRMMRAREVL